MSAAKGDHVDVMRALVAAGADAKLKAQDGTSVLTAAVASGHLDAVQYAYKIDPDVKATSSVTGATLMQAAVEDTFSLVTDDQVCEVIRFLASHGAALDGTDAIGKTPVFYANYWPLEKAQTLLLDLIVKSGAKPKFIPPS